MALQSLDLSFLVAYFALVIGIGIKVGRRRLGSADYFLAGRRLGWIVIGLSLFASNISSTTLIGLAGAEYHAGISISAYEWMASVVLVVFAIFVIPAYLSTRIYTVPEYFEKRFNTACRFYFSGLTIVGNIFIDTAGTLFAGALVVQFFFPETPLWFAALLLALFAGAYTATGGLAAVVYTDAMQALTLLVGATLVTWFALDAVGSWSAVVAATPPEMLSIIRPLDDPTMPWSGLLIGVPILGFYFWCTNQFIVQRVLGARDIQQARWGALFAGLLKLPVLFVMVFPGLMARLLYPDLAQPDLVFPTLVTELLPVGIKGLVLAGLLAAIMSSIDSTLNSASTLVTMDFVKRLRPATADRQLVAIGRVTTVLVMLFSAFWVPVVARATTLFEYLQSSLAYLFPPVVAVFVLGLFWARTNGPGSLAGLLTGHVVALSTFILAQATDWVTLHFLNLAGLFLAVTLATTVIISLFTGDRAPADKAALTWTPARAAALSQGLPRLPWYQDYRWQSAVLLALTVWLVWTYR